MIAYPDTSFLCSVYRKQIHTPAALAYKEAMTEPLCFTRLLEFEFLQAIELQVWLHSADRKKGYSRREADQMIDDWETDIASGLNELVFTLQNKRNNYIGGHEPSMHSNYSLSLRRGRT